MKMTPTIDEAPYLTTEQMVEVDRAMIEDFRIELIQMMENAGRNLAHLSRVRFLGGNPTGKHVVIMAGSGGNGGGALVAARRLHSWGADVRLLLAQPAEKMTPVPRHQLDILQRMRVPGSDGPARLADVERTADLIVDGLIGYSLRGAPHGLIADLIRWANRTGAPILSLDAPSGIDTTTGTMFDPAISATATMTVALPKEGLRARGVEAHVGQLYLADISVPPALYAEPALNLTVGPLFAHDDIVRLR
ncbi:MAG: NAD(P)H-hydrate epimerase [Acidiferrobacterales bacterium]